MKWMERSVEGAIQVLTQAFKDDRDLYYKYVDRVSKDSSINVGELNPRRQVVAHILDRLFDPSKLKPLKFEVGKYYRHKSQEPVVIFHVVTRADTTMHGKNTLIIETLEGFTSVSSSEEAATGFEEVPREEWEKYWPDIQRDKKRVSLRAERLASQCPHKYVVEGGPNFDKPAPQCKLVIGHEGACDY